MGFSPDAPGEAVEPYLVGQQRAKRRQHELAFVDQHHPVMQQAVRANEVAAAAAGLRDVTELMNWNGLGSAQMHSPARIGKAIQDIMQLPPESPPARLSMSVHEVSCSFGLLTCKAAPGYSNAHRSSCDHL